MVIIHHESTARSIAPQFRDSSLNPAFASNLGPLIARYQPELWIQRHMHNSVDVTQSSTRVLANSGGTRQRRTPSMTLRCASRSKPAGRKAGACQNSQSDTMRQERPMESYRARAFNTVWRAIIRDGRMVRPTHGDNVREPT